MALIREQKVAEMLNVKLSTLRTWRHRNYGLAYVKVGQAAVRYREEDVVNFIAERTVQPSKGSK